MATAADGAVCASVSPSGAGAPNNSQNDSHNDTEEDTQATEAAMNRSVLAQVVSI